MVDRGAADGGANKQNSQTGEGTDWRAQLGKLAPFTFNEIRIIDGKITNFYAIRNPDKLTAIAVPRTISR